MLATSERESDDLRLRSASYGEAVGVGDAVDEGVGDGVGLVVGDDACGTT